MKSRFPALNGGVLAVCEAAAGVSDFAAPKNVTAASDLDTLAVMAFDECSRRQSDYEFAESRGRSLDLKVRVRHRELLDSTRRVLIGRRLYAVYQVDGDGRDYDYLYLELERTL